MIDSTPAKVLRSICSTTCLRTQRRSILYLRLMSRPTSQIFRAPIEPAHTAIRNGAASVTASGNNFPRGVGRRAYPGNQEAESPTECHPAFERCGCRTHPGAGARIDDSNGAARSSVRIADDHQVFDCNRWTSLRGWQPAAARHCNGGRCRRCLSLTADWREHPGHYELSGVSDGV